MRRSRWRLRLAVTHPAAGNLGGGGFMMIRLKNGKTTAIDYREMAPAAATPQCLSRQERQPDQRRRWIDRRLSRRGRSGHSARHGTGAEEIWLGQTDLGATGRTGAPSGGEWFHGHSLARAFVCAATDDYLSKYAETKRIYLNNGKFYNEGDLFRQPDLAATFARLQQRGPNEFYEGETARLIVDDMKRNNGLMTMADMRGYVAKEREPLRGTIVATKSFRCRRRRPAARC